MFWGLFFSPRHQISDKSAKCKMNHAAGVIQTFSLDALMFGMQGLSYPSQSSYFHTLLLKIVLPPSENG